MTCRLFALRIVIYFLSSFDDVVVIYQTLRSEAADVDVRVEDSSPIIQTWNVEVFMQAVRELVSGH